MSDLKVEGKVADFCPKCKNCKSTTRECNGEKYWLTKVECEDPYDGMVRTLDADSDICCSMFVPKPDRACVKCERFDGTYCHGPNGTITISYKALFGEPVNCPSYEEKKEPCETKTAREIELEDGVSEYEKILNDILDTVYEHPEMFERNMTAYELLPCRVKTLKDSWDMMCDKYDPLNIENEQRKKAMDNQAKILDERNSKIKELEEENRRLQLRNNNQVTMIEGLKLQCNDLSDKLKRVESHDEALTKAFQNDEKLIDNIQKVIFPQEEGSDYTYSYEETLNKVKDLKVQSDENGTMYEDLKYWKERCHNAETDVTTLTSEVGALNNMYNRLKDKNDKEIENLKEKNEELKMMVERRDMWVNDLQIDVNTLQNEILEIRNIAQKAYDDTNRD